MLVYFHVMLIGVVGLNVFCFLLLLGVQVLVYTLSARYLTYLSLA